jgi:hypothetical protein
MHRETLVACQRDNGKFRCPRGAAARLSLNRTTPFYKMKRLGLHHLQTIRKTELKIRSAPQCTTSLRQLYVGEGAIALRYEMYGQGTEVASGYCHDRDSNTRHCLDASVSFRSEAHRVNELVVRL